MSATFKTIRGRRYKLCGGYVSWDGRGKDQHGYPIRRQKEIRVFVPCSLDVTDCGRGTDYLVCKLIAKAEAKGKKNVECRESWQY